MTFSLLNGKLWLARVESLLWYGLLVSLAFQSRVIVYQDAWYFQEWLSFAVYGTDILFLLLLFIGLWTRGRHFFDGKLARYEYTLIGFLLVSAISVLISTHRAVSVFSIVRLCEFIALYWYVSRYALVRFDATRSAIALIGGALVQSVIAILQFFLQRDTGLRWLGESVLSPHMQGVASFFLSGGEKIMRAYGTLPHPNVLAALLLAALVASCVLFLRFPAQKKLFLPTYGILLWAFVLTFSRTVIAVWVLVMVIGMIVVWRHIKLRKTVAIIGIITLVYSALLGLAYRQEIESRLTISSQDEAVQLRVFYSGQALGSGTASVNLLGVGAGNFVGWLMERQPNLSRHLYQPVHNVYLLLFSEVGGIGLLLWLLFIGAIMIKTRRVWQTPVGVGVVMATVAMLLVGLLDHFPWTLQQGRFLLWGSLAATVFCIQHRDTLG